MLHTCVARATITEAKAYPVCDFVCEARNKARDEASVPSNLYVGFNCKKSQLLWDIYFSNKWEKRQEKVKTPEEINGNGNLFKKWK